MSDETPPQLVPLSADTSDEEVNSIEETIVNVEKTVTSKLKPLPSKQHLNLVFIGHVDAGKSTTCGNIMYLTGQVDERTIEKFEREAKEKNRSSWFLAYIMDTGEEERTKGITVEVGRATFETANRRYTILDAPGHANYVPNMIAGAAQADVACLIISARKGEFERGFDRGGQTREHAMLAKTLGVNKLIIAINKMDEPSVQWSEDRYNEIVKKLTPFLKGCGFNVNNEDDVHFLPISGLSGDNMKERNGTAEWYKGDTLWDVLDKTDPPAREKSGSLRFPVLDGYKELGVPLCLGKVEQGTVKVGDNVIIEPNNVTAEVAGVIIDEEEYEEAGPGENVKLKLKGIDDTPPKGSVISFINQPCPTTKKFLCQLFVLELLDKRPLLTAGYNGVIHVHTIIEECQITKLVETVDPSTKEKKKFPRYVKSNSMLQCIIKCENSICVDTYKNTPQLGRFTIRDEGKTIAIGKILKIKE